MRLQSRLQMWLPSAVFAGLWILERRVRERADAALAQHKVSIEQHVAELTSANEQLRAINYLQSKFIADAAHELRAPLNSLKLRLHLLENGHPEKHAEYLNDLKAQLDRLARLSEDLLDISRLEINQGSDAFAPVDLNTVVEQVVITYRPLAEAAGLSLAFERAPDLPQVLGQRSHLAQVGSNLVANAINYTATGHIHVITTLAADLKRVCLIVQDTGIGIAGEDMPHLFERFYRGQKPDGIQRPGTGLGLSIVKEIVDQHGGSIEVESQPGVGTIFKVCLPLATTA